MGFFESLLPVAGAVIGNMVAPGVGGMIAGSMIGGSIGSGLGAEDQNQANWDSARAAEQFSERMSSTAHQREVKDLQAAGLNPILSAGGSGASAPSGVASQNENVGAASADGAMKAASAVATIANMKLTGAQEAKTLSEKSLVDTNQKGVQLDNLLKAKELGAKGPGLDAVATGARNIKSSVEKLGDIFNLYPPNAKGVSEKGVSDAQMKAFMERKKKTGSGFDKSKASGPGIDMPLNIFGN